MVHPLDKSSHSLLNFVELDLYLTAISNYIKWVSLWDKDQVKDISLCQIRS